MQYKSGALVRVRNRDWVVLPSLNEKLVLLKPLGGSEEEITGIYLPLLFPEDSIQSTEFAKPTPEDLGDISSARLLYNAVRLSFRTGAGPFRSIAKLSFRPRPYQMIPLIMALKQRHPIRLFIADDVGIGKTIEALIIIKELLERREISRFAVIALPHLCEQWQSELKDKIGIEAVIIRSNTQRQLDRAIFGDTSIYQHYPYQVISIDYIKSDSHKQIFINECPELVIVDEVHTCAKPAGASLSQQQRHHLIHDIAQKENQHILLLSATPHSGKQEQFASLLSLLKGDYNELLSLLKEDYNELDLQEKRKEFAAHYVQRRRADVLKWMGDDTPFPHRDAGEYRYNLSKTYSELYDDILEFVQKLLKTKEENKYRYWSALALLRGVMSSPAAGLEMIKNRIQKTEETMDEYGDINPILDDDFGIEKDFTPVGVIHKTNWSVSENQKLKAFEKRLEGLHDIQQDYKAAETVKIITKWLKSGFNPIIYCRFIATAVYIGGILKKELNPEINVQIVTSEDPDEVRTSTIDHMGMSKHRVLVATDCLSEGINLQDKFTAVLHYDLPWNPNRLEQREGRIDRFGQTCPEVKTYLLYGNNNPIDGVVLKVLLQRVREIRKATGISVPFPEDSRTLMDAVLQAVLFNFDRKPKSTWQQTELFSDHEDVHAKELIVSNSIEEAAKREQKSRSIFAQHAIKADEIAEDLKQSDDAIGNPDAVQQFVVQALSFLLGVQITPDKKGYLLYPINLPQILRDTLPQNANPLKVSFYSPTPEGYIYLGRNHLFVEQLCQYLMIHAFNRTPKYGPARAAVIKSKEVTIKTTILLLRVRNVISEKQTAKQLVAEEIILWGYKGTAVDKHTLTDEEMNHVMDNVYPTANLSHEHKADVLNHELNQINQLQEYFDQIALKRAEHLIEAHERFRKVIAGKQYKVVEPVLPMDLIGIYIVLPDK
ncbi:MAG: DEAD/DEAH box helicase [Desulfobacterales bacterium]|nr:DEAD/DEAH box helicase [Desulfobacterales bacterium]